MGLTHVAMRKLGFLFVCLVAYSISVFLGRHKGATSVWFCAAMCVVVSRWILPQLQRAEERERGGGKAWKRQRGKAAQAPTFQASSGQPESHFAQPCHTLSAVCCSTGISSQATGWRRAGPALGLGTHHHPPSSPPPPPLDSTKARFSDRQLAIEAAHSRFPPNVPPDLLLPSHCFVPSLSKGERCNLKLL